MSELMVKEFGSKEVRWSNEDKVNLVDVAKCCGLIKIAKSGNEVVKWKNGNDKNSVVSKLKNVQESLHDETIKEEISNIFEEIEESEDRNNIYISNWLAKRLATECDNKTAHEFKNWLVSLDCAREEIEKQTGVTFQDLLNVQQQVNTMSQLMSKTVDTVVSIVGQQTEVINKQGDMINQQAEEYAKDREELKEFIGLKSSHTKAISTIIMTRCEKAYGVKLKSRDGRFKVNRDYLLGHFNVSKYEDISITKYDEAIEFAKTFEIIIIDVEEKEEKEKENKIIMINNNGRSTIYTKNIGSKVIEKDGKLYKQCSCCGKFKELNEKNFYVKKKNNDGYEGKCKECKRNYYVSNRKERLSYQNKYTHDNGIAKEHQGTFRNNSKYSFLNDKDEE